MKLLSAVLLAMILFSGAMKAQDETKATMTTEELAGKVEGIDDNLKETMTDVAGLKKIKISGYLQVQFEKTEVAKGFSDSKGNSLQNPYDSTVTNIQGRFRIRRSRLKFAYDGGLTQFVVQGDFSNEKFELKDAYLSINDPWTKYFTVTTGVFNRPNYEVEYSSSQRESMERSKIIRTLYPGERDLGMMLTIAPEDWFKLQLAGYNNTITGDLSQFYPNFGENPIYYMARITKSINILDDLTLDIGAHARMGNITTNTNKVVQSADASTVDSTSYKKGDNISRTWFGFEGQLYYDFLGGMKIMGEYIMGKNVDEMSVLGKVTPAKTIRLREFNGFYVMLVKNIMSEWQFAIKYDAYDPNTKIADANIKDSKDLSVGTLGIGLHNYTFNNVRISLWYDMIKTQTSDNVAGYKVDPIDNLLTLRLQYKF